MNEMIKLLLIHNKNAKLGVKNSVMAFYATKIPFLNKFKRLAICLFVK